MEDSNARGKETELMWQVTASPVIPTTLASSVAKWATLPGTAPNEEHALTSSISTPTWTNPYPTITSSTRKTGSILSELIWLPLLSTRNNALPKKWGARIFPMLD
jgi:hypothetical protein